MEISDSINITLCILSLILAVISVITVVITLKQNNKMIENSTRPYITIYAKYTNFQNPTIYLIVKNMGQTSAKIQECKCNIDLDLYDLLNRKKLFKHIEGMVLNPGQSIYTNIDSKKLSDDNIEDIIFDIKYDSGIKEYKEQNVIHYQAYRDSVITRASTENKELKIISYTLQDLVEKFL